MLETELYFEPDMAKALTSLRIRARRQRGQKLKNKRLTYDCINAVVVGGVVKCRLRHRFLGVGNRMDGAMSLLTVLRGRSSKRCQVCTDYNGETDE